MQRIQQSIEVGVPAHIAYSHLMRFEDYPQFMEDVQAVEQLDDTHLHWTTLMSNRPVEWDAEITDCQPDRSVSWHNTSGPTNFGRVEVEAVSAQASRVTLTLESGADQVPGSPSGNSATEMAQRLQQDMVRLKELIETRASPKARMHTDAAASAGYAAGSEGWDGTEDPQEPILSAARKAAEPDGTSAVSAPPENATPTSTANAPEPTAAGSTQSDYSLSQQEGREGSAPFSVAEEINLDAQSEQARRVGRMPSNTGPADAEKAMAETMKHTDKDRKE